MKIVNTIVSEEDLQHALEDSGLSMEYVQPVKESLELKQWERGRRILLTHRTAVLSKIHKEQDKLYCTDYLLNLLNKRRKEDDFK